MSVKFGSIQVGDRITFYGTDQWVVVEVSERERTFWRFHVRLDVSTVAPLAGRHLTVEERAGLYLVLDRDGNVVAEPGTRYKSESSTRWPRAERWTSVGMVA